MFSIDRSQAERFLTLLDEEADSFTFQTFDDRKSATKRGGLVYTLHGSLDEHFDRLSDLNQKGAGVFVTVNRTDLKGRKKENIIGIRAIWMEDDGEGKDLPIEPHVVVQSSPGKFHKYLFSDGGDDREGHSQTMRVMAERYGSDPSAVDLSRVLRLPGFAHLKDPAKPHLVKIIAESSQAPYEWSFLKSKFISGKSAAELPTMLPRVDSTSWIEKIQQGQELHDSLLKLSAKFVSVGLGRQVVIDTLCGLMKAVPLHLRDMRWQDRYADIPRLVDGAIKQGFGPSQLNSNSFQLLMAGDLTKTPKPLTWLIRGYLLPEVMAMVHGKPAAGKSFLALDWACSIAVGRDWLGASVKKGPVIYIAGEGHFGIRRRLKAWSIHTGISLDDAPLAVSSAGANFAQADGCSPVTSEIDSFIELHGDPALIVIDTLNRNFGGGDENSSKDMSAYISNISTLKQKYCCAVLTVHHQGHGDAGRARGHSSLFGAMDVEFAVERQKGNDRITLRNTKMKDAAELDELILELGSVKLPWKDDQSVNETSAVLVKSSQKNSKSDKPIKGNAKLGLTSYLDAIVKLGRDPHSWLHVDDWKPFFSERSTLDNDDSIRKAYTRARDSLVDKKILTVSDKSYKVADFREMQFSDAAGMISASLMTRNAKSGVFGGPPWKPDSGQNADMSGTSLPAGIEDADRHGHTPMVCPDVRHPCPAEIAGKEQEASHAAL